MKKEKQSLIKRLHIIKGQLDGIEKMIENCTECEKTLTQIKAVRSGMTSFTKNFLETSICKNAKKKSIPIKDMQEYMDLLIRY